MSLLQEYMEPFQLIEKKKARSGRRGRFYDQLGEWRSISGIGCL